MFDVPSRESRWKNALAATAIDALMAELLSEEQAERVRASIISRLPAALPSHVSWEREIAKLAESWGVEQEQPPSAEAPEG